MADCFCGCGRKVKFGKRVANKAGQQTEQGLAVLEGELAPRFQEARERDEPSAIVEYIDGHIASVGDFREQFRAMVHGEAPVSGLPGFRKWFRDVDGMRSFLSLSPEQQQRIMRGG